MFRLLPLSRKEERDPFQLVPIFGLPVRLADWAYPNNWSWLSPNLAEIFKRAEQGGLVWSSTCTWVGHADVFSRPQVSFFNLIRLEDDLEEHGYQIFTLPILALHCQLADAFPSPVKEAVACTAKLRVARMAAECRLRSAFSTLREEVVKELQSIPETFESFKEALQRRFLSFLYDFHASIDYRPFSKLSRVADKRLIYLKCCTATPVRSWSRSGASGLGERVQMTWILPG